MSVPDDSAVSEVVAVCSGRGGTHPLLECVRAAGIRIELADSRGASPADMRLCCSEAELAFCLVLPSDLPADPSGAWDSDLLKRLCGERMRRANVSYVLAILSMPAVIELQQRMMSFGQPGGLPTLVPCPSFESCAEFAVSMHQRQVAQLRPAGGPDALWASYVRKYIAEGNYLGEALRHVPGLAFRDREAALRSAGSLRALTATDGTAGWMQTLGNFLSEGPPSEQDELSSKQDVATRSESVRKDVRAGQMSAQQLGF